MYLFMSYTEAQMASHCFIHFEAQVVEKTMRILMTRKKHDWATHKLLLTDLQYLMHDNTRAEKPWLAARIAEEILPESIRFPNLVNSGIKMR